MHIILKNKLLYFGHYKVKCAIGKRGISRNKREGDYCTPAGKFIFESLFFRRDRIKNLKTHLKQEYKNTAILTVTEFGRTIKQNGGLGTEHGYGTAIFMAGGLLKKSQVYTDWPGLKRKELFEGRDLNSTIDARSVYASAMSTVFDVDFKRIQKEVFWGENLQNLSDKLFIT